MTEPIPSPPTPFSPLRRFPVRLGGLYIALFILSRPADVLPLGAAWNPWPAAFWDPFLSWLGHAGLGLAPELLRRGAGGSGDTTYLYVHLLGLALLALLGALAWSIRDRVRTRGGDLTRPFISGLALVVGATTLSTGLAKVFHVPQGISPLVRTLTPYGQSSPMGLAQTYLDYSHVFSIFLGSGEVVGGLLLFFRRTRTLGALVLLAAMGNVAMLSLFYDMPFKIFSLHYFAFVVILLSRDLRRLTAFALQRTAPAIDLDPLFRNPRFEGWGRTAKLAFLGLMVLVQVGSALQARQAAEVRSPLYGIYDVEAFSIDGEDRPPLLSDDQRWHVVVMDSPDQVIVQKMDQTFETYGSTLEPGEGAMTLLGPDGETTARWALERPSPDVLILAGELEGRMLRVVTRARDLEDFSPVGHKFYWVF
ncbi:MAG: hypothetical protein AAGD06_19800 [Acidobacteriota bacterium]